MSDLVSSGQVGRDEWVKIVHRHGGSLVREGIADVARFPTSYQRQEYTHEFMNLAESRLRAAGRLGYETVDSLIRTKDSYASVVERVRTMREDEEGVLDAPEGEQRQ